MKKVIDFFRDENGATSIEYALIAAGISIGILVAVNGLGTAMNVKFTSVKSAMD
ncbi:MAG TPA: Flp family type IVb pilin [Afipia sp.]